MKIRTILVTLSIIIASCGQTITNTEEPTMKNTEIFLKQIRTVELKSDGKFNFEVNLADKGISKSVPLTSENFNLAELKKTLPPSFMYFTQNFADGLRIKIGNELTIFPVRQNITDYNTDIFALTKEILSDSLFPTKEFVFFGMSGVDSEMFAFYTGVTFDNGEHPVVWFTPGSNQFVLLNSSFDKFLTMQYYLLKATEYEETYATYEEAKNASNKSSLESSNKNWQNFLDKLYDTFDSTIPKPDNDYYKSAVSFQELKKQIEDLKTNSHKQQASVHFLRVSVKCLI